MLEKYEICCGLFHGFDWSGWITGTPEKRLSHLRVLVKRILRKHGYPPDKQEKATQTVLEQAEVLSAQWAAA